MTNDAEIWLQREGEPAKAYSYFTQYLELGTLRSLEKLCQNHTKTVPKISQLKNYSSTYNWVDRAEAYDNQIIEEMRKENEVLYKKHIQNRIRKYMSFAEYEDPLLEEILTESPTPKDKATALQTLVNTYNKIDSTIQLLTGNPTQHTQQTINTGNNKEILELRKQLVKEAGYVINDEDK